MRAERLLDVPLPPVLGSQLDRLEPVDVLAVEEHKSDDGASFVRLERMAGEDGALYYQPVSVDREEGAGANNLLTAIRSLLKMEHTMSAKEFTMSAHSRDENELQTAGTLAAR